MNFSKRSCAVVLIVGSLVASCAGSLHNPNIPERSVKSIKTVKGLHIENKTIANILEKAYSYIGVPYKYGGVSRSGMDCSGLTYVCFKSEEIELPRSSSEQSKEGSSVDIQKLAEGDLVFFSAVKKSKKVTHVGIVSRVGDENTVTFIHASTSKGVREDELYDEYWKNRFVKAVRVEL